MEWGDEARSQPRRCFPCCFIQVPCGCAGSRSPCAARGSAGSSVWPRTCPLASGPRPPVAPGAPRAARGRAAQWPSRAQRSAPRRPGRSPTRPCAPWLRRQPARSYQGSPGRPLSKPGGAPPGLGSGSALEARRPAAALSRRRADRALGASGCRRVGFCLALDGAAELWPSEPIPAARKDEAGPLAGTWLPGEPASGRQGSLAKCWGPVWPMGGPTYSAATKRGCTA